MADATGDHSVNVRMGLLCRTDRLKAGITLWRLNYLLRKTGPATGGFFMATMAVGQYVCNEAMKIAIHLAKKLELPMSVSNKPVIVVPWLIMSKSGRRRVDRISDVSIGSIWRFPLAVPAITFGTNQLHLLRHERDMNPLFLIWLPPFKRVGQNTRYLASQNQPIPEKLGSGRYRTTNRRSYGR